MTEGPKKMMIESLRRVLQRLRDPIEVMLVCVRWYAAYPLSLRQIEEMMAERGVGVDHTTVHRWSVKMLPIQAAAMRRRKRTVGASWRMDETYVKVGGQWKYLYRAVDKAGHTIDFLLCAHRSYAAARRFFERAIERHGIPEKITIDKSGANTAAIVGLRGDSGAKIELRQSKYLNNLIEQDHRAVKRIVRPMLGFKNFRCARAVIAGIETMHMIKKGQLAAIKDRASSAADKLYSLAFGSTAVAGPCRCWLHYRNRTANRPPRKPVRFTPPNGGFRLAATHAHQSTSDPVTVRLHPEQCHLFDAAALPSEGKWV